MYKDIDSNKRKTILIMAIFIAFVLALGWVFSYVFNSYGYLIAAIMISLIQALISYYYSDKISLAIAGAISVERKEPFLDLYRAVENLAITAGIQKPKIYVINDSAPNAFATGRDPKHSSIAVTTGLLEIMDKQELEGVIAHEMSHIGNYDIRLMTVVVVLVGAIALLSDWFMRSLWFRRSDDRESGQLQMVFLVVGIILAILAPLAATLIQLAISRKREYLADASGSLLTRYPEGLAQALEKIGQYNQPMIHQNRAIAHLYIANPFQKAKLQTWFSTHPHLDDRIKRLRAMISK